MKIHQYCVLLLVALAAASCATTPKPVIQGQDMAIEAVTKVEGDVYSILEGYNVEVKALVAEKYAKEFAMTEAALLAEQGNGTVNLDRYKNYAQQFADEIGKADEFYDGLLTNAKAQLGYKFGVAKNLSIAVQAYNKATGLDPETFQQLLDASGSLASDVIDAYGSAHTAKPSNPKAPDWKRILELASKNKIGALPQLGDPNAAWHKWLETGKAPSLSDLVNAFIPKEREAAGATPLADIKTVTPTTP